MEAKSVLSIGWKNGRKKLYFHSVFRTEGRNYTSIQFSEWKEEIILPFSWKNRRLLVLGVGGHCVNLIYCKIEGKVKLGIFQILFTPLLLKQKNCQNILFELFQELRQKFIFPSALSRIYNIPSGINIKKTDYIELTDYITLDNYI